MGNAALRDIAVIDEVSFDDLAGCVVAVDAHNWLYKYLTTTVKFTTSTAYTTSEDEEVANLIGIIQGLPKFLEHDVTPVFVFDGAPTDLKAEEIESRETAREDAREQLAAARERGDEIAAARLSARTQELTGVIHETTRELFRKLDVPFIEAPAEGEAQCAYMARHDTQVDFAGSDDYDTLLFGAPRTLRQLTSSGLPEVMDLQASLEKHDLTWEQLIDVGILCGTDFNTGLEGVGPKTAITAVKDHGDLFAVLDAQGATIEHADQIRSLFRHPNVTEEYDIDTTINPDLAGAKAYVVEEWGIPNEEVERGFERIEDAVTQTGLDQWS